MSCIIVTVARGRGPKSSEFCGHHMQMAPCYLKPSLPLAVGTPALQSNECGQEVSSVGKAPYSPVMFFRVRPRPSAPLDSRTLPSNTLAVPNINMARHSSKTPGLSFQTRCSCGRIFFLSRADQNFACHLLGAYLFTPPLFLSPLSGKFVVA